MNLNNKKLVLALSGGIDSVVALHYYQYHNLRAIHINHNLSPNANEWQKFCQDLCKKMTINLQVFQVKIKNTTNLENVARKLRYAAIYQNLKFDEILLTAHHQNDQAETLLLNLFRGSGTLGLAGMPDIKDKHYRPFLKVSKQWILAYAIKHNLDYINDESNFDTNFKRNFLRNEVLPILNKKYKNLTQSLITAVKNQQQSLELIFDLAKIDIQKYNLVDGELINITALNKLTIVRIKNIIRYHLQNLKMQNPSSKILDQIILLIFASNDKNPKVKWGDYSCRRFKGQIYFYNQQNLLVEKCEYYQQLKTKNGFNIRYKKDGQRVKFATKTHSQSLKKLMQEYKIPPWERLKIRHYYIFDTLVAIEKIGFLISFKD